MYKTQINILKAISNLHNITISDEDYKIIINRIEKHGVKKIKTRSDIRKLILDYYGLQDKKRGVLIRKKIILDVYASVDYSGVSHVLEKLIKEMEKK